MLRRVRDFLEPMAEDPKLSAVFAEMKLVIARVTEAGERQERLHRQAKSATVSIGARAQDYLSRAHARIATITAGRSAGELLRLINALMRRQVRENAALRQAWGQAKRLGWSSGGGAVRGVLGDRNGVVGGAGEVAEVGEVRKAA